MRTKLKMDRVGGKRKEQHQLHVKLILPLLLKNRHREIGHIHLIMDDGRIQFESVK